MTDHKARIREMEDEIEDAKATAHERGYYQGKAAGDDFGAAMREHVTRLEAENKALREALKDALDEILTLYAWSDQVGLYDIEEKPAVVRARAALAETEGRSE